MAKRQEFIFKTPNLYQSIGFVLGRKPSLLAFVPPKAKDDFYDKFHEATGQYPYPNETGLVFHPEGTNKYWFECRVIFPATQRETLSLFLSYTWVVPGSDEGHWNINNNAFFFELLVIGFKPGYQQFPDIIRGKIPPKFIGAFDVGFNKAKGVDYGKTS